MNMTLTDAIMKPKMWVDTVVLPTYPVGEPNKNPLFLEKRVYQGSTGKIYPLAFTDRIKDEKIMKEYEVIFLENEYIQVMIMPEMGGKIYRALDKTNHYDFVYYNQVVKPALVGLVGPWVSGGIEFNWPQHHRPSTFEPVEYKLAENSDGSKTCWVSEIDRMNGTKGMAGFTIYEDKAYIEIKGQLYNRTEVPQTFLWWANPAVAVNDDTQSIFPPDVHAVFDHGKRDVSKFPIATGVYYKMDYSEGVDISKYKNLPVPTSYMAYHSDHNFVGGYDLGVEAGILHIANHHISPGKKQWTWGNGDFGQAWDRNLTDEDGPYIELMTGIYTDNQPDFTWLAPKEEKTFKQYFMPYKGVGEVKNASLEAIINLEVVANQARLLLYTPSHKAQLKVRLFENNQLIFEEEIKSITPVSAYEKVVELENMKEPHQYRFQVIDAKGKEIIAYQAKAPEILKAPEPAKAPLAPQDVPNNEELYLIGLHIEQYRHATYLPEDYYLEALKRNSEDIRNNNAYGLLMYRRGRFDMAEKYFRTAVNTMIKRNPNPYDSEAYYNLGLSLKKQGKIKEAYGAFYKSTWNYAWQASGYYEIAGIDVINGELELALEHVNKSIVVNYHNIKARNLKSTLLRRLGRMDEAVAYTQETIMIDTTSFGALYEMSKLEKQKNQEEADGAKAIFTKMLRNNHQNYIELALDYATASLFEEAIEVLASYCRVNEDVYPMIYYYMGYFNNKIGQIKEAQIAYKKAAKANSDYCFPHRLDTILALNEAIANDSKDAYAYYYLGNLYYDKRQYEIAMDLWQSSIALDDSFPTSNRNLALAYVNKKNDLDQGLKYLEKAFENNKSDARVFFELDQLYKKMGYTYDKRLPILKQNIELVKQRDDLYVEYVALLNNVGDYEKAKKAIEDRIFHPWEGGEGKVISQYKKCRIELAKLNILDGQYKEAIELLNECKVYPYNLGEGKLSNAAENDIDYFLGLAYEGLNDEVAMKKYFYLASFGIEEPTDAMFYNDQPADMMFYQGLALAKLKEVKASMSNFNKIFDFGEKHIRDHVKIDYFAVSLPDFLVFDDDLDVKNRIHCLYLMGLGVLGKGNKALAREYLQEAYDLNIYHQGVYTHLNFDVRFIG